MGRSAPSVPSWPMVIDAKPAMPAEGPGTRLDLEGPAGMVWGHHHVMGGLQKDSETRNLLEAEHGIMRC